MGKVMQRHQFSFEVDGDPRRGVVGPASATAAGKPGNPANGVLIKHGDVTIEIVNEGDDKGEGLVRTCTFRVPKLLLSGGVGRSWECVTEVRPPEFSRYESVGKPLWSKATGWHRLDDLGDGRTRVEFGETYHAINPVVRVPARAVRAPVHLARQRSVGPNRGRTGRVPHSSIGVRPAVTRRYAWDNAAGNSNQTFLPCAAIGVTPHARASVCTMRSP